jgi:hypothetical protein
MKPSFDFDEKVLNNADKFKDEFYKRFKLRHAPQPLQLNDKIAKNYLFPTFYGDVTCAIAIFFCSYSKAEKIMLHPKIKPVNMTKGRSLVVFSCYEYKNVLGVAPYNEIAMTIPILVDPEVNIPILPMLMKGFPRFGYYVFSMPVTSLENQIRGVKIWGLPKVVQEIDIHEDHGDCVTIAKDSAGEPYFELYVPMQGKPISFDVQGYLYSQLEGRLLKNQTNFKATFHVTQYPHLLWRRDLMPDRTYLKLGSTPMAQVLKDLQIYAHPFQFRYTAHMRAAFDLPNLNYRPPITL